MPRPSRPSQEDVVSAELVVGELYGAEDGAGDDNDCELDEVVKGGEQPIPSPKSPVH